MTHQVFIVDVFALKALSGNPLAVIVGNTFPAESRMQGIAAEMNFSETTFVRLPACHGKYSVRIFTPVQEIEFTGHPLIGTAAVIRMFMDSTGPDCVFLQTAIGPIRVDFEPVPPEADIVWMRGPAMQLGAVLSHESAAHSLGLQVGDLDPTLPVQVVAAGTSALLIPLRTAAALSRAKLDLDRHAPLVDRGFPKLVYLFCQETCEVANDFQVRFFFDANGVREDPATGNGAAFFGNYLLTHQPELSSGFDFRLEQGYPMGRPSLIRLRGKRSAGHFHISVGGSVYPVMQGEMLDA